MLTDNRINLLLNLYYYKITYSLILNFSAPNAIQRDDCRAIFNAVIQNSAYNEFFNIQAGGSPSETLIFDFVNVLYSLKELDFSKAPHNVGF